VQGPIPSITTSSLYDEILPATMWPTIEMLFKSCLAVIFIAFSTHASLSITVLRTFRPELEKIMYSLQFMFADSIVPLVQDYRLKRYFPDSPMCCILSLYVLTTPFECISTLCVAGFMLLGPITKSMQDDVHTPYKVFCSGLAMGWVNIMVQTLIPQITSIGFGLSQMVAALSLACLLQSVRTVLPGMGTLQGYVEWHISNIIQKVAEVNGVGSLDLVVTCCVLLLYLPRKSASDSLKSSIGVSDTLVNIMGIVAINTTATRLIHVVLKQTSFDIFSALIMLLLFMQAVVGFYSHLLVAQR
jgi:hypothetical protein